MHHAVKLRSFASAVLLCLMMQHSLLANDNPEDADRKCLILLHGLARSHRSMKTIAQHFAEQGYFVWNESYPSTEQPIEQLSGTVAKGLDFCKKNSASAIYIVTHSMGGILVRHFFQNRNDEQEHTLIRAVVMLSPPNHGSEIVDAFRGHSWFHWLNGPAGSQLGTEPGSLPNQLAPVSLNIGVITGNVSSDPWFGFLFNGPYDGKVSVESAKLAEMKDFLVVGRGHTFIMNSEVVIKNIEAFFQTNIFIHESNGG